MRRRGRCEQPWRLEETIGQLGMELFFTQRWSSLSIVMNYNCGGQPLYLKIETACDASFTVENEEMEETARCERAGDNFAVFKMGLRELIGVQMIDPVKNDRQNKGDMAKI